ncbi:sensor domain-containing diguanylate cyclase [Cytobacillus sp. S13-E01]|uniref:sensor domain-containing diguanylate cyclase n=1 Tax=Cytobacillus sp. S13-E01 TaxID=3031326 RepID=UPI0023D7FFAC|nr:sensor domain-containing diguanylate cyclase [Cytobacillus sp. S13-E01]MDF0725450.1 sensor domain-containing diguanylate cyclase [Cytobacillus sp. S13-E01]
MRLKAAIVFPFLALIIGIVFYFSISYVSSEYHTVVLTIMLVFIMITLYIAYLLDKSRLRVLKLEGENEYLRKREEENSVTSMFDSVLDLVYLVEVKGHNMMISSVNRRFLRVTGIPKQKVIGTNASEIFGGILVENCKKAIKKKGEVEFTSSVSFPQGVKDIETTIHPIRHENEDTVSLVVISKFVSARKQAAEMLKETENHFQFITDNATDIIMKLSADSSFLYVSPIIEKILGVKPKDILYSKNSYDFINPLDHDHCYLAHQKMLSNDEIVTFKFRAFRTDHKEIWLESTGKRIITDDNRVELICITRDITVRQELEIELMRANEKLEYLSFMDGLTEVGNRRKFDKTLMVKWNKKNHENNPLSVLMFDIDCFKEFNDTYGHVSGDSCLKAVASTVDRIVKRNNAELFRYGGEEFIVLFPNASIAEAFQLGKEIVIGVKKQSIPHITSTISNVVTVSVGVVSTDQIPVEADPNDVVDYADKALYHAKRLGKNRVVEYIENVITA